ncbi:helix-turn-helix domain-containing protein [Pseudonocardia sp. C8]|uniref:helix-turn-helix domain-containing protein n=1 Tax=Pseudonocardia sp. C8 TaxID=2762759 RepID=UPI0016434C73|nr:helix-turn-helix domain-containing protein [Pseudonocardia sp. C8]MBC3190923.1 helix-turn-helix domain-containing protein [Pseudonocardia sp. C8]
MAHTTNRPLTQVAVPVPESAPRFYSVAQAAQMLGMSAMTLYRAINSGGFPAVRIRGRLIVPAKAIEVLADLAVAEQTVVDAADWVPVPRRSAE